MTAAPGTAVAGAPEVRAVLEVDHLSVSYRTELFERRVHAVRDISFTVHRGEIFGFLGPNGAGKTTTIRVLMGLVAATRGGCRILGDPVPSRSARARLGFLPEAPYFYDYLTVTELLDLVSRLCGIDRATRRRRAGELIELVGLRHATRLPLRKYSKGMLQRAGIAQALVNDPELVVLDEPMSGLDPIGRKQVRDIILGLRDAGKTVFFSTHILPDVEMICDRVAIIVRGQIMNVGALADVVEAKLLRTEVILHATDALGAAEMTAITRRAGGVRRLDREIRVELGPDVDVDAFLAFAHDCGAHVISVSPQRQTLEDVFIRSARTTGDDGDGEAAEARP
jgi:ABC-2 type transport system ATP-binding protein